jgi:hypothetical protein
LARSTKDRFPEVAPGVTSHICLFIDEPEINILS